MSFYVVPISGTGTKADPRVPAFIAAAGITSWQMAQFGNSAIVWADATAAEDTAVGNNAGAIVVPPLDNQIGSSALSTVQADVEALNMPADWITAAMTYRTVLRVLIGMAEFFQAVQGQGVNPVLAGNLDKTISSLAANVVTALQTAATQLGLSTAGITGATTIRAMLFNLGNQFAQGVAITFGNL